MMRRTLLLVMLGLATCSKPSQGPEAPQRAAAARLTKVEYLLLHVCLPYVVDHVPVEQIAAREHLHRKVIETWDIESGHQRSETWCGSEDRARCVVLRKDYCDFGVDGSYTEGAENLVSSLLAKDIAKWRQVDPGRRYGFEIGRAYCDAANTVSITTHSENYALVPDIVIRDQQGGVHRFSPVNHRREPGFEVHVSRTAEPAWCASPCRLAKCEAGTPESYAMSMSHEADGNWEIVH
jgi:hypothetical protein